LPWYILRVSQDEAERGARWLLRSLDRLILDLDAPVRERSLLSPEDAGGRYFDRDLYILTVVDPAGHRHRQTFPREDLEDLEGSPEIQRALEDDLRKLLASTGATNSAQIASVTGLAPTAGGSRRDAPASVLLHEKMKRGDFDVFLCHNSEDKPAVKKIGEMLRDVGILPWLDESELRPGLSWQRALEEQIEQIKSAAVFVAKSGIGPWQRREVDAFLREFVDRDCPVIPVLLQDAPDLKRLPIFLKGLTWVDFRKTEPDPMEQLIWGITGDKRPRRRLVTSSNIASVAYDPQTRTLEVEFCNGGTYQYFGVPARVHAGLMNAGSKGAYFYQNVKARFPYTAK